jgi:hypothetical protein
MQGRLNIFQKTMLQWDEMHPYIAVHVVRVRGVLDAVRLRTCINATVGQRGLAHLSLNHEQGAFQYDNGSADCEVRIVGGVDGSTDALVVEVERQLNRPFDCAGQFNPFRFLVAPAGDSFFLGLSYFHPAADAESVVLLLKDIVESYLGEGSSGESGSPDLYPDHRARLWLRHPGVVARRFLGLPAQVRNLRGSHRVSYRDASNMANGFTLFSVGPETLRSTVEAAKSWKVTVNDLLLALLLKCLSPLAVARTKSRKRRKLSVGCIVNLRKDIGVDSRKTFGLFLGSFSVTHEVPEGISLRQLAEDMEQQTASIKRHKSYLGTPLELTLARFMLKFYSPLRRKKFYAKNFPLWGGITNMNLNSLWEPKGGDTPLDYFRGVSTGPITPLVLSVTTMGDRANIGLSYRTSVFSPTDIEGLKRRFLEHLGETRRDV